MEIVGDSPRDKCGSLLVMSGGGGESSEAEACDVAGIIRVSGAAGMHNR